MKICLFPKKSYKCTTESNENHAAWSLSDFEKQSKISLLLPHIYVWDCLKFFGDFWVYLGRNNFSQGWVKFMEIGHFEDLMLF